MFLFYPCELKRIGKPLDCPVKEGRSGSILCCIECHLVAVNRDEVVNPIVNLVGAHKKFAVLYFIDTLLYDGACELGDVDAFFN